MFIVMQVQLWMRPLRERLQRGREKRSPDRPYKGDGEETARDMGGNPQSSALNPGKSRREGMVNSVASQRSRKMRTEKCPVNGVSTETIFSLEKQGQGSGVLLHVIYFLKREK